MTVQNRGIVISDSVLKKLLPCPADSKSKAVEYSDIKTPCLRVLVSRVRVLTFYYRYTFQGRKRALRIGTYPAITIAEVYKLVAEYQRCLEHGRDPQEERDRMKEMPSFEEFAPEYLKHVEGYKKSVNADESKLRIYLIPAFGKRRLCDITLKDIQVSGWPCQKRVVENHGKPTFGFVEQDVWLGHPVECD